MSAGFMRLRAWLRLRQQSLKAHRGQATDQANRSSTPLLNLLGRVIRLSMAARLAVVAIISTLTLVVVAWTAHSLLNRQLQRLLVDPELSVVIDDIMSNAVAGLGGEIALKDVPLD